MEPHLFLNEEKTFSKSFYGKNLFSENQNNKQLENQQYILSNLIQNYSNFNNNEIKTINSKTTTEKNIFKSTSINNPSLILSEKDNPHSNLFNNGSDYKQSKFINQNTLSEKSKNNEYKIYCGNIKNFEKEELFEINRGKGFDFSLNSHNNKINNTDNFKNNNLIEKLYFNCDKIKSDEKTNKINNIFNSNKIRKISLDRLYFDEQKTINNSLNINKNHTSKDLMNIIRKTGIKEIYDRSNMIIENDNNNDINKTYIKEQKIFLKDDIKFKSGNKKENDSIVNEPTKNNVNLENSNLNLIENIKNFSFKNDALNWNLKFSNVQSNTNQKSNLSLGENKQYSKNIFPNSILNNYAKSNFSTPINRKNTDSLIPSMFRDSSLKNNLNFKYHYDKDINLNNNNQILSKNEFNYDQNPNFNSDRKLSYKYSDINNIVFRTFFNDKYDFLDKQNMPGNNKYINKVGNYQGDILNGLKHGFGILLFGGNRYEGEFHNNMRHGTGVEFFKNGDIYMGNFLNDNPHGKGIEFLKNGNIYKGNFVNKIHEGFGILEYYQNNLIYEGNFSNNKKNGLGVLYYANGAIYHGSFKDGKKTGYGFCTYKDGSIFEGEFLEGEKNGNGIANYANGDFYSGNYKNNLRHGFGVYENNKGWIYEGEFLSGKSSGKGVFIYKNGDLFEGDFFEGKKHGYGIYYFFSGDVYVGEFRNNFFDGFGEYTFFKKRGFFKGIFKNNKIGNKGNYFYFNNHIENKFKIGQDVNNFENKNDQDKLEIDIKNNNTTYNIISKEEKKNSINKIKRNKLSECNKFNMEKKNEQNSYISLNQYIESKSINSSDLDIDN